MWKFEMEMISEIDEKCEKVLFFIKSLNSKMTQENLLNNLQISPERLQELLSEKKLMNIREFFLMNEINKKIQEINVKTNCFDMKTDHYINPDI
jgi:hypothetical protein